MASYTVSQLGDLAGVSVRTLHYYDEIGLLAPSWVADNGYRYYDEAAVLRLQQILLYRELGLPLAEVGPLLDAPDFDVLAALREHRAALQARIRRLTDLIDTVDNTMRHLMGESNMDEKKLFVGFDEEEEKRYVAEAREEWGAEEVDASYRRWNSYSAQQKAAIQAEGSEIYRELAAAMPEGPESPAAQALVARWHDHMRYFYEPSVERLRGLGQLYVDDPRFAANFRELAPGLPEFLNRAITAYCDRLEQGG